MAENPLYRHGGEPSHDFLRLGLTPRQVIDFSVNINPLGPPGPVGKAWGKWRTELGCYPSPDGAGVLAYYRERFGLLPESVVAGNGSTELIYLVCRALDLKTAALAIPTFHDYGRAIRLNGGRTLEFPGLEGTAEDWARHALRVLPQVQALWIGNPNNPDARLIPAELILDLASRFPDKVFLVDEAFIQFIDHPEDYSLLQPQRLRRNLVVFHSLTKFYALAGLRLGGAVGHPETMARIRSFKPPWSVSLPAERAAALLGGCRDYEDRSRRLMARERAAMAAFAARSPLFEALPPTANFILGRWTATPELDDLLRGMLRRGIYLRDARNFSGLSGNWFRFSIRGAADNRRLRQAFRDLEREGR